MAVIGGAPRKRHGKGAQSQKHKLFAFIGFVMLCGLYYYMTPKAVKRSVFGGSSRIEAESEGDHLLQDQNIEVEPPEIPQKYTLTDSKHRIERVDPQQWNQADVASWLNSIGMARLKSKFRRNEVDGKKLLHLDERALVREIAVNDDEMVERLLHEIKLLKHIKNNARKWGANRPPSKAGSAVTTVEVYNVGDSMLHSAPVAKLSKKGVVEVRELVAQATKHLKREVREFVAQNGELITSVGELPPKVFALCERDFYVFPTEELGFKQTVPLPSSDKEATVETLSLSPRVFLVDNFLSSEEANGILNLAKDKMGRSTIAEAGDEEKNGVGEARTSSTAWLSNQEGPLINSIRERVADLVKVPMYLAEDMQVLHYSKKQHYWAHHDYFDPSLYRGFVVSPGQNRFITVFFYLSDVEEGGETVFPFAGDDRRVTDFADCSRGLKVKPKAGSAIVFYSLLAHNHQESCPDDNKGCNLDVRSLHGGCDVIRGDKWAANYWIANRRD